MPDYLQPQTLDAAIEALRRDPGLRIIAGGTDVYPSLGGAVARTPLLDLTGIADLKGVTFGADEIRIGALASWTEVQRAGLPPAFQALVQAGREVGSPQIQNAGTVVGNICNASPAADGTVALLALGALVEVAGPSGVRRVPLGDFVTGVRRVALAPGEIVTAVTLPMLRGRSAFQKLGARRYLVISIAMVAAHVETGSDGRISRAAVAVGSCSPVALRLHALEARLTGLRANDLGTALRATDFDALAPIDDVRAAAAYRHAAVPVLARRALMACMEGSDE
jgi:CO/xanthine dehydrogenase FAD-binding subunit